jgi:hypothetical protein
MSGFFAQVLITDLVDSIQLDTKALDRVEAMERVLE